MLINDLTFLHYLSMIVDPLSCKPPEYQGSRFPRKVWGIFVPNVYVVFEKKVANAIKVVEKHDPCMHT